MSTKKLTRSSRKFQNHHNHKRKKQPDGPSKQPVNEDIQTENGIMDQDDGTEPEYQLIKLGSNNILSLLHLYLHQIQSLNSLQPWTLSMRCREFKVMFVNEIMYQVPDSRGGYQLAVRQDEKYWRVGAGLSLTKAKEAFKKADPVAEKGAGPRKAKHCARGAKAGCCSIEFEDDCRYTEVRDWVVEVNDAVQKEEGGSIQGFVKEQVSKKDKKEKHSLKVKEKMRRTGRDIVLVKESEGG
ncbi:uncharacterized protein RCO7_08606 [Rhynchosporium graminicola]|uniref:Uncharacterized protein n=1 Tax=Rhynchosporium graminicola TaxID=2792576 RepID=A0A1E1JWP7_9HELO|nr:uncharacterized protein RCO7_08606 [Rhynchosporium commune]